MTSREQLIQSIKNYRTAVEESLSAVSDLLAAGRYDDASDVMTEVTTRQAQVSIRMRNACDKLKVRS